MNNTPLKTLAAFILAGFAAIDPGFSQSTKTWIGSSSNWSTPSNWSGGVPGTLDTALIDSTSASTTGLSASSQEIANFTSTRNGFTLDRQTGAGGELLKVSNNFTVSTTSAFTIRRVSLEVNGTFGITGRVDLGSITAASDTGSSAVYNVTAATTTLATGSTLNFSRAMDGSSVNLGSLEMTGSAVFNLTSGSAGNGTGTTENVVTVSRLQGTGTVQANKASTTASLVVSGTTSGVFSGNILNNASGAVVRLTKSNTGSLELSGTNTFSGGTSFTGGILIASSNSAFGTGTVSMSGSTAATLRFGAGVTVANSVVFSNTNASSLVQRTVNNGVAFSTGTSGGLQSSFVGGTPDTTARFLSGTNTSGSATILDMNFASSAPSALNDGIRLSDVFDLANTGTSIFVLQLSASGVASDAMLGWLNTSTNLWVNATSGNTGNNASGGQLGYQGTFASFLLQPGNDGGLSTYIGAYGNDGAGNVWAVLNHNSDFSIIQSIPEPSTWILLGLGISGLLFFRKNRRHQS